MVLTATLAATERVMSETPGSTRYDATPLSSEQQNRFVAENMRRVFLLIYRVVGNVADAQDLTQEAFIKALQRQDQLKDLEKAAHWLSRIATNTAIDFLRRAGRVNFADLDSLPEPDVEDLPAEEVALRLKCSKATVRSHIANARVKLRRYMERKKI
jgi:RNA polymerase sigma-70 factor (ECF subfamily)